MTLSLYDHQLSAIDKLDCGSILCGGVGSGKSRTALAYYYLKEGKGSLEINGRGRTLSMRIDIPLYIITTAKKRNTKEWEEEASFFPGVHPIVDSWNNIRKYVDVENAFFIFDEQRVVGYGTWAKTFIKISRKNRWILLSATPGDTWMDYVPVFIANGFYTNKTAFERRHVVYSRFAKYPKVERYVGVDILERFRNRILVQMPFDRPTISHHEYIRVGYDKELTDKVIKDRWNIYTDEPLRDAGSLCLILRRIANSDKRRFDIAKEVILKAGKIIIFYNFNYELEGLRELLERIDIPYAEYNGHKHESVPSGEGKWAYLVQYTAGAEGWNCVDTDTILFFSQSYSYRSMEQAAGRIDRLNTPFLHLWYYHLVSNSPIDISIKRALDNKKNFNERAFYDSFD